MTTSDFVVTVNLPRSHVGAAELRVEPDSVTLTARPVRHHRAIVAFIVVACVLLVVIGVPFVTSGMLSLKDPGLSAPARATALRLAYGTPVLVGLLAGVLVGGMFMLFAAFRGDPQPMTQPRSGVSLAKHRGRVLVLRAAFGVAERSRNWTLVARNRDDAAAIVSALTTGENGS